MTSSTCNAHRIARRIIGGLFVLTGGFKMLIWPRFFAFCHALAPSESPASEPQVLGAARAILFATALIVPPLEVAGGVLLWRGKCVRLSSALLALDMLGAILTVGVPGRFGRATDVGGVKIGAEAWRLPLEIILMLACAWMGARGERKAAS